MLVLQISLQRDEFAFASRSMAQSSSLDYSRLAGGAGGCALNAGPDRLLQVLDLYWRSAKSGGCWHKSIQLKKTICSREQGGAEVGHSPALDLKTQLSKQVPAVGCRV